jgi:hypothetical protein
MHAISSIIDGHCMSFVIFVLLQNIISYSNIMCFIGYIREVGRWQEAFADIKRGNQKPYIKEE